MVFRAPAFRAKAMGCRQGRKFKDIGSPMKASMSGLKAVVQTVGGQQKSEPSRSCPSGAKREKDGLLGISEVVAQEGVQPPAQ